MSGRAAGEGFNVAVVGGTGLVGETMIEVLEERKFPVKQLFALASERKQLPDRELPLLEHLDHGLADQSGGTDHRDIESFVPCLTAHDYLGFLQMIGVCDFTSMFCARCRR